MGLLKWFKDLINRTREYTKSIEITDSKLEINEIRLGASESNGYFAWKLRTLVSNGELPEYTKVKNFILKFILEYDPMKYAGYTESDIQFIVTDEIKKFCQQAKMLGYKCSNNDFNIVVSSIVNK